MYSVQRSVCLVRSNLYFRGAHPCSEGSGIIQLGLDKMQRTETAILFVNSIIFAKAKKQCQVEVKKEVYFLHRCHTRKNFII